MGRVLEIVLPFEIVEVGTAICSAVVVRSPPPVRAGDSEVTRAQGNQGDKGRESRRLAGEVPGA